MFVPGWDVTIAVFLGALVASAFFSGSETGLMSVNRARLRGRSDRAGRRVDQLEDLLGRIEEPVMTCLIGTNLTNVLGSAVVTAALSARYGARGEWLAVIVVSTVVILLGEIVPKVLYREFPERLTLASTPGIRVAMVAAAPVRWVLRGYSALWRKVLPASTGGETLDRRSLAALLLTGVVPSADDRRFAEALDRYLHLAMTPLLDLARPVESLCTVGPDDTVGECLRTAARSGFSRLPITSEDGRRLQGYVLVRDLLFLAREEHDQPVPARLRRSILLVDGRMDAYELFEEMRAQGRQLAVVADPDGNPQGLVTLEDLIETVVGSIDDEFDLATAVAGAPEEGEA
ncbi:MAG TPA: CNNM domain-containing protein [Candidatus Krumholzibacteria bacterium]|nr:CNNM domain-containing protein [Candidatus Krumholzibacteria bacterium]